jgi:Type I restriction enzyme R protein N terminus (HSDR_N)
VNEEEVKIKYVLPWLKQSGVVLQDLQFEQTFSVKIGRQQITVGECREKTRVGARLDILVRRGDRNLFVVETKADSLALTDEDRDQAISYARLVHPIAPYAVVTNGNKYRLYDAISKKEIQPESIQSRGFEATLPDADIAEAQRCFFGLSRSNLQRFCQQQVDSELRLVRGTLSEDRKYVRDLHVPRESIRKDFADLYVSPQPGLLLVGESGSGKTCELCFIAETLLASGRPVLFFNGFSIATDITQAIADEFSWTFSGSDTPVQVLKRIESFAGNEFLTIVIDAIDEWMSDSRSRALGSLLRAAEHHRIRMILSCKTSVVDTFLQDRSNPTHVSILAKPLSMPTFSAKEFFEAIEKYRQAFKFFGHFEDAVLKEARENPFLLRVFFDTAREHNLQHLTFSAAQFFEEYYNRSLRKTCDVRQAEDTLIATARLLCERNIDSISELEARSALGLRVNDAMMEELFEYALLVRTTPAMGERLIRFHFQQLRDYIIAYCVLQLQKMSVTDFARELDAVSFPSIKGDVFTLYYRLASREHQLIFDGEVRGNAARYLKCYTSLVQTHFPAIKSELSPGTDDGVGFVGELILPRRSVGLHGFRPLDKGDDDVHFLPMQRAGNESNLAGLTGVKVMHHRSTDKGFRNGIDIPAEVLDFELLPQIRELVKAGQLNESNNPDLLAELTTESVLLHRDIFSSLLMPDGRSIKYPLKLDAVLDCILRKKLNRHFRDEIVSRKRRAGEIREQWSETSVTYAYSPTPADEAEVLQKVADAIASGELPTFRACYVELERLENRLGFAVRMLRQGRQEITGPLLSGLDRVDYRGNVGEFMRSTDQLKESLRNLYLRFMLNYRSLIEANFPSLRKYFKLYAEPAQTIILMLGFPAEPNFEIPLTVLAVKSTAGESSVEFVDDIVHETTDGSFVCKVNGIPYPDCPWIRTTVRRFIASGGSFARMHLRAMVYGRIQRELAAVEEAFRSQALPTRMN